MIKITFRNITRQKLLSLINILGLAIGMTVCILIFLWAKNELSYDRFNKNRNNIYGVIQEGVWNDGNTYGNRTIPYQLTPVMQEIYPEVANHVRLRYAGNMLIKNGDKEFYQSNVLFTEPALFEMFSFQWLEGDLSTAFDDVHNIILTESTAHKYFGNENPLGKAICRSKDEIFTITGICADPPKNSSIQFTMIIPFTYLGNNINGWSWDSTGYVQLHENTDIASFKEKIRNTIIDHDPRGDTYVRIQPLSKIHLYGPLDEPSNITFVIIFSAIGIIVLLIACINFMNLSTARSVKRAREVGIKKVVGASRGSLIRQFLGESILTTFLALIFAFVLVELFLPVFNNLAETDLSISLRDHVFLIGLVIITLFVGLVSGSYPALFLSRYKPIKVLKSGNTFRSKNRFRTVLVIFQFTISIALIISTITVYNQMKFIRNKDLGFTKDFIVSIPFNQELRKSFGSYKNTLLQSTNIMGVTTASTSPANVGNVNPAIWEGKQTDEDILFNFFLVEKDFLNVFDMEIIQGQNFSKDYQEGTPAQYIVNEAAVKIMGLDNPIGKKFAMWSDEYSGEIVGVVKDYHFKDLTQTIGPIMITTLNWYNHYVFVKIAPQNVFDSMEYIKKVTTEFSPGFPYRYSFLDKDIEQTYSQFYNAANIIKYFAVLAVFISCLGLFGLASFMTEQRTKEIGIRKVMGASSSSIVGLLSKEFSIWIIMANIIAWPVAFIALREWLKNFAYSIDQSILTFILAGIIALIIALITVSFRAIKAAGTNPAEALKYE